MTAKTSSNKTPGSKTSNQTAPQNTSQNTSQIAPHNGFLLDTHTLYYLDSDPENLIPTTMLTALQAPNERLYVSSLSAWEMSIKHHLGKWPEVQAILEDYHATLIAYACNELPFQSNAALLAGKLPLIHKDPFDRGLIAQAITHNLSLISIDPLIHAYNPVLPGLNVRWES
jgi:PIN domain nuclease of toxin-antitoxin system